MIVVFDLDDTLYPEETFVRSGFREVARVLAERWGVPEDEAFEVMWESLERRGRGTQFDDVVAHYGLAGRQSVPALIRAYRSHRPQIALPESSRRVLEELRPRPMYVVTDGHKVVQQNKIDALGIAPYLRHAYITHRYGIRHRKPSVRVFELLMRRERCAPEQLVYIGDDPSKDFKGIRPLGIHTIRVLTGRHATVEVPEHEDAAFTVDSLTAVPDLVRRLERGAEEAAA